MSKSYSSLHDDLIRTKGDKEYRHAYAEESLNLNIATQIKVLREQRKMKQEHLAEEAGMTQSMISRYENVNYLSWSINTLKKLARAFDVYLEVRFRSFGKLVESVDNFNREALEVLKFIEDPKFEPAQPMAEVQPTIDMTRRNLAGDNIGFNQSTPSYAESAKSAANPYLGKQATREARTA